MSETTQDSINVRLAKLLGYTVRYWRGPDTRDHWDLLDAGLAVVATEDTEAEAWQHAPDFEHSLDATTDALKRRDVTLMLHFGVPESAVIIPYARAGYSLPPFKASDADVWAQERRHADIEELAAMALEEYLLWRQDAGQLNQEGST